MASAIDTIANAIFARVESEVVQEWDKALRVQWPNAPWDGPPTDRDETIRDGDESDVWLRVTLTLGTARQAEFGAPGSNTHRATGLLTLGVFERADKGVARTWRMVKLGLDAFRAYGTSSPKLQFGDESNNQSPYPQTVGVSGGWHQTNVICPFFYDETA